jgi:predicted alpha/beta-fold hydrolase
MLPTSKVGCLADFDSQTRAQSLGFSSRAVMYRNLSCGMYLPAISIPVLFLLSKDDPITRIEHVPLQDLARNSNFTVCVTEGGGHIEFFYTE